MSWIFSFLLLCYVLLRLVLRARGQLRWLKIRKTLPVPPPMTAAPEHLSPPLAAMFEDSLALRADLVRARVVLTEIAVKDPDAPLGRVRDAQYRRTLIDSFIRINKWLRAVEQLDGANASALADMRLDAEAIVRLRDSLRDKWRQVSRARALDPFALEDLFVVQQTFERIEIELAMVERGLARLGDHPYRDRHPEAAAV